MNDSKRFILLGAAVVGLGVILGTALWLKLHAPARFGTTESVGDDRLKQYGAVPDFKLIDSTGKSMGLTDLSGKVWVVNFIYTTCTDTCPLQSLAMAKLQKDFTGKPVKMVSISVDPERDTPQVLAAYAAKYDADGRRWHFLTGQREQVIKLIRDGFHLSVAVLPTDSDTSGMIPHSPRFVLVDGGGQIRGYYDSREMLAMARLKSDLETLLKG
jgi:cytochrome oxidase Cu insertion factor (SCO1/SenC/PrrC family)